MLAPDPFPGRFRFGLSWDEGHEPIVRATPDIADAAERQQRAITFRFDDPPTLVPPADAPARFRWQRVVEYSDFADWKAISRHFAPLYVTAAAPGAGSTLKSEIDRIAAAHADPLARAKAALRLVQQEVRYIYVGLDGGNLMPASADETWQRRYGDCKGKTALLLALLAGLGIQAEAVLANNAGADDGLDERLPNPGLFDHVLVRAKIGGKTYWLDGTLPPVAGPDQAPVFPYRWVLPLSAAGSTIERVAWTAPVTPDELELIEIDARAGFDEPARVTTTSIKRGLPALEMQSQMSALTPNQLVSLFRQHMVGSTWQTVDDVRWRYDEAARAGVLTITGTWTVDWDSGSNGSRWLSLPGGGFSPPERRVRPAEQNQDLPYYSAPGYSCNVTTVRLPEETRPTQWSFNSSIDTLIFGRNYYRAFGMRDGAIRMARGSRVTQPEIDAATARRANGRIANFDNSMARIGYSPTGGSLAARFSGNVPTTSEIDWTADRVPCLPPDELGKVDAGRRTARRARVCTVSAGKFHHKRTRRSPRSHPAPVDPLHRPRWSM
ncbi:MAG: transglutaminase domain-containing protein [Allosphingosinicella sp.]|uniref:transglutaminase domain-containing protein n=1 Tax=Allosphingosinicella sp. TaxID=2823234 RepID=UPI003961B90F